MSFPTHVRIVEVGPRDGLQNEIQLLPTETKIAFINKLTEAGLPIIEATSFVSSKWIPQFADASAVFASIKKKAGVRYPVLVPNLRGFENAYACGVRDIAVFTTPSEQFSKKNTNCTVTEGLLRIEEIIQAAKPHGIWIRGYLSCVLGCPYEGDMAPHKVAKLVENLLQLGCDEISLGDTIGIGTPAKTEALLKLVLEHAPVEKIGVHFHDTYGQALTNIYVALEAGIATIDSSVSGLGGCPYAKGASGNVATEDVVYMLNGMRIKTGIELKKLIAAGRFISEKLGRKPQSKVNLALMGMESHHIEPGIQL